MSFVKMTGFLNQISKLRTLETAGVPVDLGNGARPRLTGKDTSKCIAEERIETGIEQYHQIRRLNQSPDLQDVDHLALDHLIGSARKPGDFERG
jgi:hypothetical protein